MSSIGGMTDVCGIDTKVYSRDEKDEIKVVVRIWIVIRGV